MKTALIVQGGWEGHFPEEIANRFAESLTREGFQVTIESSLECLSDAGKLKQLSLIVPCWTMGQLSEDQEKNLCQAVHSGVGLAGAHGGMGDAFRAAAEYNFMVGGQFVSHPHVGTYTVRVKDTGHPLVQMLPTAFEYDSEQYFLHVDPSIRVLLESDYSYGGSTVAMPVSWIRNWGNGRVFYCSLGHAPSEYDRYPEVWRHIISGCNWAAGRKA